MNDEGLNGFFRSARPEPPADLSERVLAGCDDPELARGYYWAEVGDAARSGLRISLAGLLVAGGVLFAGVSRTPAQAEAPAAAQATRTPAPQPERASPQVAETQAPVTAVDQLSQLAMLTPQSFENQAVEGDWPVALQED